MKKILGATALLAAAVIAGGATLIHGSSREPLVPASETTRGTYRLHGSGALGDAEFATMKARLIGG